MYSCDMPVEHVKLVIRHPRDNLHEGAFLDIVPGGVYQQTTVAERWLILNLLIKYNIKI